MIAYSTKSCAKHADEIWVIVAFVILNLNNFLRITANVKIYLQHCFKYCIKDLKCNNVHTGCSV